MIAASQLLPVPRLTDQTASAIINDYWWPSGQPDTPAEIPLTWLSRPLNMRLERPFNHAEVTQSGGSTARADNPTSIATAKGVYPFRATLYTDVSADAYNLAHWTVTWFGDPRMRCPTLIVNLVPRTDDQRRFLLRLQIGRRIRITGVPAQWPSGADHLVIVGIVHELSMSRRLIRFTTAPVVGAIPGEAGPWFRLGTSILSGTDSVPF